MEIAAILISFASLLCALYALRQSKQHHVSDGQLQVFCHYTQRYESLMQQLDADLRSKFWNFDENELTSSSFRTKLKPILIGYLNLCSEEYALKEKELIDIEIWNIWEDEIKVVLKSTTMIQLWPEIKQSYESHDSFYNWVNSTVPQKNIKKPI